MASGYDEEQARQLALESSKDLPSTIASGVVAGAGGVFGAEKQISRALGITPGMASSGLKSIAKATTASAGSEALQEGIEGFAGEVGSNVAQQERGLKAGTFDNALSSAATGAATGLITGGIIGGAASGIESRAQKNINEQERLKREAEAKIKAEEQQQQN